MHAFPVLISLCQIMYFYILETVFQNLKVLLVLLGIGVVILLGIVADLYCHMVTCDNCVDRTFQLVYCVCGNVAATQHVQSSRVCAQLFVNFMFMELLFLFMVVMLTNCNTRCVLLGGQGILVLFFHLMLIHVWFLTYSQF